MSEHLPLGSSLYQTIVGSRQQCNFGPEIGVRTLSPRRAVEHCPERQDGVDDERGCYRDPRPIPHQSVDAALWCKDAKILQQYRHLH